MENQDIQFTFDKKPVLSQSQQDSLNIKLKHIILLEQELGFVVPVLYTKPKDGTLFNLKQYVEDINSRKGISKPEDYSAISMFLDNNIIHLESMKDQKESKQEVPESPKKEETSLKQPDVKFTFYKNIDISKEQEDHLNQKLSNIIHIEMDLLKFGGPVLYSEINGIGVIKLEEFVKTISELSCTCITITYEEVDSMLNYALDRLLEYLKK